MHMKYSDWILTISRNMSFFQACLDISGHYKYSKYYNLISVKHAGLTHDGFQTYLFTNKDSLAEYLKYLEDYLLAPGNLQILEKQYAKYGRKLLLASNQLERHYTLKNYKEYILAQNISCAGLFLTAAIGRHMLSVLEIELKKYYDNLSNAEMDILMSDLTYPTKHSPLAKTQIELLQIGALLQSKKLSVKDLPSDKIAASKFGKYVEEYAYVPVNFNENPWTASEIKKQLSELMKGNCTREIKKLTDINKQKIKRSKIKLARIKNSKIKRLVKILQSGTYLNEYRKFVFCRASVAYRPLFQAIADKYQLSGWRECWKLSPREIERLYFRNDKKVLQILKNRQWGGVVPADNKDAYAILGPSDLKTMLTQTVRAKDKINYGKGKELSGVIANKGKVRAVVRIILSSRDFHKFKNHDVIVTSMTSVDFVPLMYRASAFVTNEGGITSHAAVVSREMNKPCIIGTKIATKFFKDGDMVEVDANNGIIKKL